MTLGIIALGIIIFLFAATLLGAYIYSIVCPLDEEDIEDYYGDDRSEAYEDDKVSEVYRAAEKSLKINLMQMDAFREMEEAAEKYSGYPQDLFTFEDDNE